MKQRMTFKKSWDKRLSKSFSRPIIKKLSFEKKEPKPTKLLNNYEDNKQDTTSKKQQIIPIESFYKEDNNNQGDFSFQLDKKSETFDEIEPLVEKQDDIKSKNKVIPEKLSDYKANNKQNSIDAVFCNNNDESSDQNELIPELVSEVHDLYDETIKLRRETHEIADDIKDGRIDEVVNDLSEIIEESREIVVDTREIVKNFKLLYGVAAGLTPIFIWGISFLILKKPK